MKKRLLQISLITIFSFIMAFIVPVDDIYRGIITLPGVAGLGAALFQLIRDDALHQRAIALQKEQHLFNLGATSHMANCVFDKHVEFCEKYLAEVHQTVVTLTREGPTALALEHAGNLYSLRIEYTAWITPEIEQKLMPFEKAVRRIGANSNYVDALRNDDRSNERRSNAIEEMFDIFSSLMNISESTEKNEENTVIAVKSRVREILQVNQLVSVREYLVSTASKIAEKAS